MKKKIVIVSPDPIYGGSLVLFKINQLLNEEGIDSRIFISNAYRNPKQSIVLFWIKWIIKTSFDFLKGKKYKFEGFRRKYLPFIDKKNTIVIYHDKIFGNFLGAQNVVRYFLYYNMYSDEAYGKDDFFICYRKQFNDYRLNPECYELNISTFNKEIYKKYNYEERQGNCYIVRKGKNRKDLPNKFDGPIIDDLSEQKKVKIFNEYKYCYSYDTQTFYTKIAAFCGCIPIIVMEDGKNINDYLTDEDCRLGEAYGSSKKEIEYAKNTQEQLRDYLNSVDFNNKQKIKDFIELLEKRF